MLFDYIKNPSDVYEIITDRYSSLPVSIYQKNKCHRTGIMNLPMTWFYCRFHLSWYIDVRDRLLRPGGLSNVVFMSIDTRLPSIEADLRPPSGLASR